MLIESVISQEAVKSIPQIVLAANILAFIFLWKRAQHLLYFILSFSLLLLLVLTVIREVTPEWIGYQKEYIRMAAAKEPDAEKARLLKTTPIKIRQIWIPELGVTDRCVSCHLAVDNQNFKNSPEPFRYHEASQEHDLQKIGCTICHRGQGLATEKKFAHAKDIPHWDSPMLEMNLIQASCPQCHERLYESGYELEGAEMVVQGRDLTTDNNLGMECVDCHTIRGMGEMLAPNLTEFGAYSEPEFKQTHIMTNVEGDKTIHNWVHQHFLFPEKISPGDPETGIEPTTMPNFEFTDEEAHSLSVLVLSFKTSAIPDEYRFRKLTEGEKAGVERVAFIKEFEEVFRQYDKLSEGQQLFIEANCWFCHKVNGRGGYMGPDLSGLGAKKTKEELLKFFTSIPDWKLHPMVIRFEKFSKDEKDHMAEYLSSLK